MTLEQINYVMEVEKTRSINKAAGNLFISQSALSLAIQNLERELRQPIFSRTNRGVLPTPFGRSFIRYIAPIQTQLKQIDSVFFSSGERYSMTFTMANDGFQFGSEAFAALFQKYQPVGVCMKQLDSYGDEARSLVAGSQAEVGVIRLWSCYQKIERQQLASMGLIYQQLYETGLAVLVGPRNPLYGLESPCVTPEQLEPYPMLKYGYLEDGPFKDVISRIGLHYSSSALVTSSRAVIAEMIERTNCYFLTADLSAVYTKDQLPRGQRFLRIEGSPVRAELGWVARRGEALSPIATEFTYLLDKWFQ